MRYLRAQSYNLEQAQEFTAAISAQARLLDIYTQADVFWPLVPPPPAARYCGKLSCLRQPDRSIPDIFGQPTPTP